MFNFLDQNNHYHTVKLNLSVVLYVKESEWSLTRALKQRISPVG